MAKESGWVLYDGECSFCTRVVKFWEPVLRSRGFQLDALQSEWVTKAIPMPLDELLHDIRLLTPEGKLVSGADVYLYAARRIWWLWPFFVVFSLPGFHALLWGVYRRVAANRYCISGACRLPR